MPVSVPLLPADQADLVDAIARRVVEILDERQPTSGLVDARTLAGMFGLSVSAVHEHADELGAFRLGTGARRLVRFDVERARAAWSCRTTSEPVARHRTPGHHAVCASAAASAWARCPTGWRAAAHQGRRGGVNAPEPRPMGKTAASLTADERAAFHKAFALGRLLDNGREPREAVDGLGLTDEDAQAIAAQIREAIRHARVKLEPDQMIARTLSAIDGLKGGRSA